MSEKMDKELEKKVEELVEKKTKKKNNNLIIFLVMLLVFVFVAFAGYILMDKGIIFSDKKDEKTEEVEPVKEELDINSRLVKELYSYVGGAEGYWRYDSPYDKISDFHFDNASEKVKMQLVSSNLIASDKQYAYNCSDYQIPETNGSGHSVCKSNDLYGESKYQSFYKKSSVENIYKKLFGKDAKLDTSVDIYMDRWGGVVYTYVAKYDAYFEYLIMTGGTGPEPYSAKLSKAYKEGNKLYIYEDVKFNLYNDNLEIVKVEKSDMIYTFELDADGMYKFISRVEVSK